MKRFHPFPVRSICFLSDRNAGFGKSLSESIDENAVSENHGCISLLFKGTGLQHSGDKPDFLCLGSAGKNGRFFPVCPACSGFFLKPVPVLPDHKVCCFQNGLAASVIDTEKNALRIREISQKLSAALRRSTAETVNCLIVISDSKEISFSFFCHHAQNTILRRADILKLIHQNIPVLILQVFKEAGACAA